MGSTSSSRVLAPLSSNEQHDMDVDPVIKREEQLGGAPAQPDVKPDVMDGELSAIAGT